MKKHDLLIGGLIIAGLFLAGLATSSRKKSSQPKATSKKNDKSRVIQWDKISEDIECIEV